MDELELLKKHWQSDTVEEKQLSSKDLYPMLWKKSSSIVKTLFYISIAELIFWVAITFLPKLSTSYREQVESTHINETLLTTLTIISFVVILLFIYLLYKAYKSISVTDNAKKLMESILSTRKVIKYYVGYNLVMAFVSMILGSYYATQTDPKVAELMTKSDTSGKLLVAGLIIVITVIFVGLIWLFYKLLYGILMKRLNRNYKELKKLEV
ncbi:hypothetical protein [Lacinutrix sp. Bg11-31]|uniref:hypothetical protein n=1 Tax=Lacinutrix sp. Bg11-31 TaxID=2057808 RepID=UPI000C3172D4|nr:hypothetical protein [Lacinutrix sp. Bg11-31]AUC80939.1 hypothetical protein CW733_01835 [Lacinutrix sp. Bg11-31]